MMVEKNQMGINTAPHITSLRVAEEVACGSCHRGFDTAQGITGLGVRVGAWAGYMRDVLIKHLAHNEESTADQVSNKSSHVVQGS
jgi:hypothetical protein